MQNVRIALGCRPSPLVTDLRGGDVAMAEQCLQLAKTFPSTKQQGCGCGSPQNAASQRKTGFLIRPPFRFPDWRRTVYQTQLTGRRRLPDNQGQIQFIGLCLFPLPLLLADNARLLRRKGKPPARKASFLSGYGLAAEAEGRMLVLNGQALYLKASFLSD